MIDSNRPVENQPDSEFVGKWPKGLAQLFDVTVYALRDTVGESKARILAAKVIREVAFYMGGRMFYLPRGNILNTYFRNQQIWHDHTNGVDVNDLATRYRLSNQQVGNIIREQRSLQACTRLAGKGG